MMRSYIRTVPLKSTLMVEKTPNRQNQMMQGVLNPVLFPVSIRQRQEEEQNKTTAAFEVVLITL